MHFLADVYVPCEVCGGKRYNRETLDVKFKGKSIFDVLEMTVDEGAEFFEAQPKIYRKLKTLQDVGLGYIKIVKVQQHFPAVRLNVSSSQPSFQKEAQAKPFIFLMNLQQDFTQPTFIGLQLFLICL